VRKAEPKPQEQKQRQKRDKDVPSQLNILGHDGDTLGVNGAEIGVLKEADQVGLGSLLKSKDGTSLETQIVLEVLGNLTDETLERELADEKVG
jgi:histone H3